ncbi:MAG TPA: hypothetical protein VH333_06395 [Pseudonocardiaceae bacterium]|nr:hypothetical protein [Pseudonocardiaceae bacterium]
MNRVRTVPLSWAQRAWVLGPPTLTESDGWRHDLGATIVIPRHVGVSEIKAALAVLIRTYPALRARLVSSPDGGGVLDQEIVSAAPAGVCVAPAELDPVRTAAVARRAAIGSANIGAAVQYAGAGTTVTLAMAHAFVDGWAVGLLRTAFEQALCPASAVAQDTLFTLLEFERSAAGVELSRRNVRRLVSVATKADRLGLLPSASAGASHEHGDLLAGIHDSTWLLDVLRAPPSGLARAATLLSLVYLGYCRWRGTKGAVFVTPVANRVSQEQQEFVGLMMMRNWVLLDWRPDEPFSALADRVTTQLLRCALHGRFDPVAALDELDRAGITASPRLYFNYAEPAGFVVPPRSAPRPETTHWRRLPSGGVPFEFNAYVGDDGVMVITKFDEALFSAAEAERFGHCLREVAALVCRSPDLPVSQV